MYEEFKKSGLVYYLKKAHRMETWFILNSRPKQVEITPADTTHAAILDRLF